MKLRVLQGKPTSTPLSSLGSGFEARLSSTNTMLGPLIHLGASLGSAGGIWPRFVTQERLILQGISWEVGTTLAFRENSADYLAGM